MNSDELQDIRDELERRWPLPNTALYDGLRAGFMLGAQWEREKNSEARKTAEKALSDAQWQAEYDRTMNWT